MSNTRNMTKMALLVALLCVSAYISFPLPFTPAMVTALTLVMCLVAYMLPPRETFIVLAAYVLLGAIGLPVFVGGSSGFGKLFGPTGGFIWAWLIAYPLLSYFKGAAPSFWRYVLQGILWTIPITYIGGMLTMILVLKMTLPQAFIAGALPFIPGDIIKIIVAAWLATKIRF